MSDCSVSSVLPNYLCGTLPYKNFNKMQAECLETWQSDENMLISAPTGAGKTVCFELAILRFLHQALGTAKKKRLASKALDGKMVYIAPTKSLCSERAQDWHRKFRHLGLRVHAITGDLAVTSFSNTLRNTDLIVATAEKWDSITRNVGAKAPSELSAQIRLLLLDEVHQVGDTRGAVFESVVTRMLLAHDLSSVQLSSGGRALPAASLRIIAVSATVANVTDIARWLRVSDNNTKVFDDTYRPVSLEYHALGYSAKNPWLYAKVYDNHMLNVVTKYGEGKPCIVFCTSRKQTVTSAQSVLDKLIGDRSNLNADANPFLRAISKEQKEQLVSCAEQCNHALLRSLLPHGIAIHNADMNVRTRNLVERLFRDSLVTCLFSTSTLAQGVNLPARLVVIAGTTIYNDGCLAEYQQNLLLQMCGRAGRPGLDTKGVVVIMTALSRVSIYERIGKNSSNVLTSQLSSSIAEVLNAEVARKVITDVPSAVTFLSTTLFWTQTKSSLTEEQDSSNEKQSNGLHSVAMKAISTLSDTNLIQYDADHFGLSCTLAGILMARYCLSVDTMRSLMATVPKAASPSQILRTVASCVELHKCVSLRRSEKKRLNQMNEWIRIPLKGKVQDRTDKIIILLQIATGDQKKSCTADVALRSEAQRLLQLAARVSGCVIAMALHGVISTRYETVLAVLQVCRGLQNKCLWDGPTVLRQVPGISASDLRALNNAGILSLAKLSEVNPETLHREIGCRSTFASTIDESLRGFPRFVVKTEALARTNDKLALSISVSVVIMSARGNDRPRQRRSVNCFIVIGTLSCGLWARHVFPLSDGRGSISCPAPRDFRMANDQWIDVLVGCDSLCGTDVSKRIWIGQPQESAQVNHGLHTLQVPHIANRKLSVTEGRLTKKRVISLAKPGQKEKYLSSMSTAKAFPFCENVKKQQVMALPIFEAGMSKEHQSEEEHSSNQIAKELHAATIAVTKREDKKETERNEQEIEPNLPRKQKRTPARSEAHIALPRVSLQDDGKEYDDVFRGLF